MATPPRLVLDTNVCLDLFVFGDASCATLREALRTGVVVAVSDEACRAEWLAVLAYPQLALAAARQAEALAACDAQLQLWSPSSRRRPGSSDFDGSAHEPLDSCLRRNDGKANTANTLRLPRCRDPDDQKFLELAQACGARWLLSRDRELLKLARRTRRGHGFDILTPRDWALAYSAAGDSSLKPV